MHPQLKWPTEWWIIIARHVEEHERASAKHSAWVKADNDVWGKIALRQLQEVKHNSRRLIDLFDTPYRGRALRHFSFYLPELLCTGLAAIHVLVGFMRLNTLTNASGHFKATLLL